MFLWQARHINHGSDDSDLEVISPEGRSYHIQNRAERLALCDFFADQIKMPVDIMWRGAGLPDSMPVSIMGIATVKGVAEKMGITLPIRQYRPNIVVETIPNTAHAEDWWVGQIISVGDRPDSPELGVSVRDVRCNMVNLDPDTTARNGRILKNSKKEGDREPQLGVYASVNKMGTIHQGDPIFSIGKNYLLER